MEIKKVGSSILGIALFVMLSIFLYIVREEIIEAFTGLPAYLAIFILSFVGALSVIVPIPYTAIIFTISITGRLDPILTALSGGLGSGIGEISGWVIGRLVSRAIEETKYFSRIKALIVFLEKKGKWAIPLLIYLFALTPLPDDIIFIVLGVLRYGLIKALIPSILGKTTMMLIITEVGRTIGILSEEIGIDIDIVFIATLIALIILLALMMFIKWDEILVKYLKSE